MHLKFLDPRGTLQALELLADNLGRAGRRMPEAITFINQRDSFFSERVKICKLKIIDGAVRISKILIHTGLRRKNTTAAMQNNATTL